MHRTWAIAAVALTACASGAGSIDVPLRTHEAYHEHLVPESECRGPSPESLDAEAMAGDIEVLASLLARGYAGYADVQSDAEWSALFAQLHQQTPARATAAEFRDRLREALRVVDDNHVGVWTFEPRRTYRSTSGHAHAYASAPLIRAGDAWVDLEGRTLRCAAPGADRDARIVASVDGGRVGARWLALSRGPMTEFDCVGADGGSVQLPAHRVDLEHGRGPAFERIDADVPWFRLRSLMTTHDTALDAFVEAGAEAREAPVVVVDLRHAGGGSDRYLRNFFAHFSDQPLEYWRTGTLRSETMLQGARNFWGCVRAASGSRDSGGRAWVDARIRRADRELDRAMRERGPFHEIVRQAMPVSPSASAPFAGRMIVVVGRGCQSACESAVVLARQIPGAVVVGENTGGVMKVGELRWYRLPESRIWISLGHRSHTDPHGEFREALGFEPDLWLTEGETDASIEALLACFDQPECAAEIDAAVHSSRGSESAEAAPEN